MKNQFRFHFWIMKISVLCLMLVLNIMSAYSQVGINTDTPDSSAVLDLSDTERGLLVPRLTRGQRQTLENKFNNPANGLMLFDRSHKLFYFLDATDLTAGTKGTWKALNPWTLRGTFGASNNNDVIYEGAGNVVLSDAGSNLQVGGSTTTTDLTANNRVLTNTVRARTNAGLQLYNNANKGIYVDDNANVGIGNNTPNDELDVNGSVDVVGGYKIGNQRILSNAGIDNTFVGTGLGTGAFGNTFIGANVSKNSNGNSNTVIIGANASTTTAVSTNNVVVGADTRGGGTENVAIGYGAGKGNMDGNLGNVFLGAYSGYMNGSNNICIGKNSGYEYVFGNGTVPPGDYSGYGDNNIVIGNHSGFNGGSVGAANYTNAIVIGNDIIANNNDALVIGNNGTSLITGSFTGGTLSINADLTITGACTGCTSDKTLKTNIEPLQKGSLEKISRLNAYTYTWKKNTSQYENDKGLQIGLMAQEVQKEFPLLVDTAKAGHLYIDYQKMVVPLVESVKELNSKLDEKEKEIIELKEKLSAMEEKDKQVKILEARLDRIEKMLKDNQ